MAGGAGSGTRSFAQQLQSVLRGRKTSADAIKVDGLTASDINKAAKLTEGFSGRELAKFMASVQVCTRLVPH